MGLPARAQDAQTALDAGTAAFQQGSYPRAIESYEKALEGGMRNGYLYFNLANAYQRSAQYGRAILNYRRAQLYLPRNADISANLATARQHTRDKLDEKSLSTLELIFFWNHQVSERELSIAGLVFNALFWGGLMVRRRWRLPAGGLMLTLAGVLTLLAVGTLAAKELTYASSPSAVVVHEEVSVRSGSDGNSVTLFNLHDGAEVEVQSRQGDWAQIVLPDGKRGWMEMRFLGLIVP
jgi:tetratricopeptide (TPR) repeat protein